MNFSNLAHLYETHSRSNLNKNISAIDSKQSILSSMLDTMELAGDDQSELAQAASSQWTSNSSSCIVLGKDLETRDIASQHLSVLGIDGGGATEVAKVTIVIDYLL